MSKDVLGILKKARHSVDLKVSGYNVEITSYTHGDTKGFLEISSEFKDMVENYKKTGHMKSGIMKKMLVVQRNFVADCVAADDFPEAFSIEDLPISDIVQLYSEIKRITKGEISLDYYCANKDCGKGKGGRKIQKFKFDFSEAEFINDFQKELVIDNNGEPVTILFNDFTLKTMIQNSLYYEAMAFQKIPKPELIDKYYSSLISGVRHKNDEGEEVTTHFEDRAVLLQFIAQMSDDDFDKVVENMKNIPRYEWKKEWECSECGTENKVAISDVTDFFSIA